jgi:hypothetical protein
MAPYCAYIYAYMHGIILPNASTLIIVPACLRRPKSPFPLECKCVLVNVSNRRVLCSPGPSFCGSPGFGQTRIPTQRFSKFKLRIKEESLEGKGGRWRRKLERL